MLVGGGHAHVQVLRRFGMQPFPGIRLTLISRETLTPYSGMLPGLVAGRYQTGDAHIDLVPLAGFAGARLIEAELVGLDLDTHRLHLTDHPDVRFDLLSLNTGAAPAVMGGNGLAVKPIGRFLPRLKALEGRLKTGDSLALVGGGPGGVELALALRQRFGEGVRIRLVAEQLLPDQSAAIRQRLKRALSRRQIEVVEAFRVVGSRPGCVVAADGRESCADHLIWVTGVSAPAWPRDAGLATDADGFIRVDSTLRSVSHPEVFAAGDIASLDGQQRPKAGVFAVRQGPVLAENLRRALLDRSLRRYRAQRRFLMILGLGDGRAVAARGPFSAQGAWVWRWKDRIDQRFMAQFRNLPIMSEPPVPMRCTGCGSKLGAGLLARALARLPPQTGDDILLGIGDDAAVIRCSGEDTLLCVDGFPSMTADAYRFGRIVAHHCLNDLIAMGGYGSSAVAFASIPLMSEAMMEDELFQLLRGAVDVLNPAGVMLVGGHSIEGPLLTLSLTLTGSTRGMTLLTKAGLKSGQALILTKPLGTGVMLAAQQRGAASGEELTAALTHMDQSNLAALEVLRTHGVTALTDISGFGLLGHLGEMLKASGVGVTLCAGQVPALPGVRELLLQGVMSSLQQANARILDEFRFDPAVPNWQQQLLVDPQTAGGLLAGVPQANAGACVRELVSKGFTTACSIASTTDAGWSVSAR